MKATPLWKPYSLVCCNFTLTHSSVLPLEMQQKADHMQKLVRVNLTPTSGNFVPALS